MDIENLIERLMNHKGALYELLYKKDMEAASTALSTLQDENEKLREDLARVTEERDALIKRTAGDCWSCIRRYECNSRKGPHRRCWEFDPWLLKED